MQNWNQWQLPAAPVTAPMPQPPIGFAAPGADPMTTMQAYMQYYNQPAPSGYTAEQWSAAQQQNWSQWQTWQQQYQQWQAQYGEKYQETMKQMSSQSLPSIAQIPPLPVVQPPPLPKEDTTFTKPPLPPESSSYGFAGIPPPHQNNLPLFPSKNSGNPPLPPGQPPLPTENSHISSTDNNLNGKRGASSNVETGSAKKLKTDDEELTEAEKTFDAQFKQWEEQFNKWKQQNANHPDKTQYKQYEAKWTSWREKLIERREQMRRKREQQKQATAKAEAEKNKPLPGDEKILNILSSTENQGLINNLLGIGKTLGLTGKQEIPGPPPSHPPAPMVQPQNAETATPMGAPTLTPNMNQAAWAAQQWAAQYNAGMNMTNYNAGYQQPPSIPPPIGNAQAAPMPLLNFNQRQTNFNQPPGNFNQPPPLIPSTGAPNFSNVPPNLSANGPNFSLPPPGFRSSNAQQQSNPGQNSGQRPGQGNAQDPNSRSFRNDGDARQGPPPCRDSMSSGNDRFGFEANRFSGPPPNDRSGMNRSGQFSSNENFGRDGSNKDFGSGNQSLSSGSEKMRRDGPGRDFSPAGRSANDFRSNDRLGNDGDRFQGSGFDRDQGGNDRFGRDGDRQEDHGDNRFNSDRDGFNPDRFNSNNERFGSGNDRFSSGNDRFNSGNDRSGPSNDQSRQGGNRFGSSNDRFGSGNDQFGSSSGDRFGSGNDQFGASSGDRFSSGNDQFGANSGDRFGFGNDQFSASSGDRFGSGNDQFGISAGDRFGSGNDQFGASSGDRFGSSNDRQGLSGDRLNQSNDRFGRPPPDRFDSRDGSRDSFGSNSRGFGRSNQFDPPDAMAPELKKLMEKRKVAMDVFKPSNFGSFLVSDRNNSTSTSLSESFRKITGDLPFSSRSLGDFGNKDNFGGRGPPPGPSGNFDFVRDCRPGDDGRSPDFKLRGTGDFKPRGSGDFRPRGDFPGPRGGDFNPRGSDASGGPRRLGDFPPRMGNDFGPPDNRIRNEFNLPSRNEQGPQQRDNFGSDNRAPNLENSERMLRPHPMEERKEVEENFKSPPPAVSNASPVQQIVPPLQMPPWMTANFADDDIIETPVSELAETAPSTDELKDKTELIDLEESDDIPEEIAKKSDALPFMGENDPKPEDLNMEPPPDLPNLGPVIKGPERLFDQRGNMSGPFGPPASGDFNLRPPFDAPFAPRGMQMGPRGPMPFGPRGPNDSRFPPFGPRGMGGPSENMGPLSVFGPQASNTRPFGPRGPQDDRCNLRGPPIGMFGPRGPSDFSPRGPPDFGPRGPSDFAPRDSKNGPFGPRSLNDRPFGPRGPLDRPFEPRGQNDTVFGTRPAFGSTAFALRGNLDVPRPAIPSLMAFKLDGPPLIGKPEDIPPQENEEFEENRGKDLPPAFRGGDQDQRAFGGNESEDREIMDPETGPRGQGPPDWRQPFTRNKFGDSDQRSGPGDHAGAPPMERPVEMDREISAPDDLRRNKPPFDSEEKILDKGGPITKPFDESSGGFGDNNRTGISNFMSRRSEKCQGPRGGSQKEFCIEKQFNYNHGTGVPDEISTEHTPAKVIDYAHAARVIVHDYVTPAQCFDYGHGNLKPTVPDHEMYGKKDFKHWIENEQNLKDYTDRMKVYELDLRALNRGPAERETGPPRQQMREPSWVQEEKRSFERDRRAAMYRNDRNRRDRDTDDYRERDRENRERGRIERDREWERNSNRHREDRSQHRRSNSKDRTRERPEKIRKESNKENSKDDERSKGNVSGQESSAKKPAESTSQDNSEQEIQHVEPELSPMPMPMEPPKPLEMPKSLEPPKTMELPKTPNFTMVDDLLASPGRQNRPPKIVVILRGPPGSGKSFVAKLIKDKEVEQGGSAPRILSIDDYFLTEKEVETNDDNGKKVTTKEMVYEYEEAMEQSYITSLIKAFKKNITDGFFNFIILDSINEKISDYEEMWSFAKTKGFRVYVCEMEMDTQICLKRNIHKRSEDEVNRIVDYFEPTPGHHQKLDVTSLLQEEAIEEVQMEDSQDVQESEAPANDDSQDSQEDSHDPGIVSKWERMEAEDKLDRLDGLAKKKNESTPHTMEDFLQVPDYYNMEDTSGKKRVRWADLEERKEQEKMRAVGFVVGQTNWDRMMDPTKGGSALTRTKYI